MQDKTFAMTRDDLRLLHEAVVLLLAVKQAARATQDVKQVEALIDKMFVQGDEDEP